MDDPKLARALLTLVHLLLDAGADPNAHSMVRGHDLAPSYFAISARRLDATRLLFERRADATVALSTALWNTWESLIAAGGDVKRKDVHGLPPKSVAIAKAMIRTLRRR